MRTRAKFCCIGTPAEAEVAVRLGASALSLDPELLDRFMAAVRRADGS